MNNLTDAAANLIIVGRDYPHFESVAYALKLFLEKHETKLNGSEDDSMYQPPEFKFSDEYGCLVPMMGSFIIKIGKRFGKVEIFGMDTSVKVSITCDRRDQDKALSILNDFSKNSKPPISIRGHIEEKDFSKSMSHFFEILEKDMILLDSSGTWGFDNVCYEFLPEVEGYVPIEGIFSVREKEFPALFRIKLEKSFLGGLDIEISGSVAHKNRIEKLLNTMTQGHKLKDKKGKGSITMEGELLNLADYSREDIGGLDEQWLKLEELVSWPLENAELLKEKGITAPKAILLYGPPGTGKTLIAKILACEAGAKFIAANLSDLTSMWWGEDEKRVRQMFRLARKHKPAIIFLDEFDAIGRTRGSSHDLILGIVNQLLVELDGIDELEGVLVIAATNRLDAIDPAIIRPGRFAAKIEIPLPDQKGREKIIAIHTKKLSVSPDVSLEFLAKSTDGFSGADIAGLCNDAAFASIRRYVTEKGLSLLKIPKTEYGNIIVEPQDFEISIQRLRKAKAQKTAESDKYIN